MVRYFLKKLKERKGSYNITVVTVFLQGGGKDISQRKMTSSYWWKGFNDSMVPGRVMIYMSVKMVKWVEGCTWKLCRKIESNFTHPTWSQLGVGLVLWNTNAWCFQCFRFQGVSPIDQIFFGVCVCVFQFWGIWDLKSYPNGRMLPAEISR